MELLGAILYTLGSNLLGEKESKAVLGRGGKRGENPKNAKK